MVVCRAASARVVLRANDRESESKFRPASTLDIIQNLFANDEDRAAAIATRSRLGANISKR